MNAMTAPAAHASHAANGARLVAADGRELVLSRMVLRVDARGGLALTEVTQTFRNPFAEPLTATYLLPLPHAAAVSGFAFVIGDQTITGEIDRRAAARQRFEEALITSHSAALLEQDRSTLFRQMVGNIPPHTDVEIRITLDQRLAWVDDGWELRFPTVVAPRYLGAEGRVPDAERVTVSVADQPLAPRLELSVLVRDGLNGRQPASPSHAIHCTTEDTGTTITLAADAPARLDRDVVIRWPVATPTVGAVIEVARPPAGHARTGEAHALLTLVPPAADATTDSVPRDLIVLIDTSGSMSGAPLEKAKAVVAALIGSLADTDSLELIEFSNQPRRFFPVSRLASEAVRNEALAWLMQLHADGATEMRSAVLEALAPLRDGAQRQVVLVTDGLVGFEAEVIAAVDWALPAGARLHTAGVGAATNQSLLAPLARVGRGSEIHVDGDEDLASATTRLLAALAQPQVVDLKIDGVVSGGAAYPLIGRQDAPTRLPDLMAGRPALIPVQVPVTGGRLLLRGQTAHGEWSQTLDVPAVDAGSGSLGISRHYARERVEDCEVRASAGDPPSNADIERLGLDFQIATRHTSWIAVSQLRNVDPQSATRRVVIPHELPQGMSMAGLGLRARAAASTVDHSVLLARQASAPASRDFVEAAYSVDESAAPSGGAARFSRRFLEETRMKSPQLRASPDLEIPDFLRASPRSMPSRTHHQLRGRRLTGTGNRTVLEIDVHFDFDWNPGVSVRVRLQRGGAAEARIVASLTTRPGRVAAGTTVRLVLEPCGGDFDQVVLDDSTIIDIESA